MEIQEKESKDFESTKIKLQKELEAYAHYVEDANNYYQALGRVFSLEEGIKQSIIPKNFHAKEMLCIRKLDGMSPYDKSFLLQKYEKMKSAARDKADQIRAFAEWRLTTGLILSKKQKTITALLPVLKKILNCLNEQNLNSIFLALLTHHGIFLKSRVDVLRTDPAPVFSVAGAHDNFHEQRKIAIEETKHNIIVDFLELLYPFVQNKDKRIQRLLSYFPVLSRYLAEPTKTFSLDEYVLDGVIFNKYGVYIDEPGFKVSNQAIDQITSETISSRIIDVNCLQDVRDPTFALERTEWIDFYKKRFTQVLPQRPIPEDYLKGLKKRKKRQRPRKKPINHSAESSLHQTEEIALTESSPKIDQPEMTMANLSDQATHLDYFLASPSPESSVSLPSTKEKSLSTELVSTPLPISELPLSLLSPEDLPILADQSSTVAEESNFAAIEWDQEATEKYYSLLKREAKIKAKVERELRAKDKEKAEHVPQMAVPVGANPHPLLPQNARFKMKTNHYELLISLLKGEAPPTTSYNIFVSALAELKVKLIARGNGDKRTMVMPNGRKELIFRPATSEVGHYFIKKVRKALQEKWGLREEHLY